MLELAQQPLVAVPLQLLGRSGKPQLRTQAPVRQAVQGFGVQQAPMKQTCELPHVVAQHMRVPLPVVTQWPFEHWVSPVQTVPSASFDTHVVALHHFPMSQSVSMVQGAHRYVFGSQ